MFSSPGRSSDFMGKIIRYPGMIILSTALWVVLNEKISVFHIVTGVVLGVLSLYITDNLLMFRGYRDTYTLKPFWLLKYLSYLIFQIYRSGFTTIGMIVSGRITPGIVEIETEIRDEFRIGILANSITLTPGTVTLDVQGQKLTVLWLNYKTRDPKKAGELIKGRLEKLILGG